MNPYRYRLQPLLDQKLERRDELVRLVARLQRELAIAGDALAQLESEQGELNLKLTASLRARLSLGPDAQSSAREMHTLHLRGLIADVEAGKGAVAAQRARVIEVQDRVAEARNQLVGSARDVDVLNKHRDRLRHSARKAVQRKEAIEQDELGNVIFNQRGAK